MAGSSGPKMVSDSLILYLDAGNTKSKVSGDIKWNNLGSLRYGFTFSIEAAFNDKYIPTATFVGGTNSYISSGATPDLTANVETPYKQVTYNMWMRGQVKTTATQVFWQGGAQSHARGYFTFTWGTSNGLVFQYAKGDSYTYGSINFSNFFASSNNEWVNMTMTVDYDAVELLKLYRNGVLFGTMSFYEANYYFPTASVIPVQPPVNSVRFIGNYGTNYTNSFTGDISIAQIYSRILTPDEILRNYNTLLPRHSWSPGISTSGLQIYLDAGDRRSYPGTGTVWTDLSPNGFTFSLSNTTYSSVNKGSIGFKAGATNSYAARSTSLALYSQTSYSFWAKCNYAGSSYSTFIGDYGQSGTLGFVWIYRPPSSDTLTAQYADGANFKFISCSGYFTGYSGSDWINITVTIDYGGASTTIYRNGVKLGTIAMTGTPIVPRALSKYIGAYGNTANTQQIIDGSIAVAAVYNRILSDDEVYLDYQALRGRYFPKVVAWTGTITIT